MVEMPVGAVYNTLLGVAIVSVPQPAPEQVEPVNCQVTPLLAVSLASVALNISDCPVSIFCVEPGIIWTVIAAAAACRRILLRRLPRHTPTRTQQIEGREAPPAVAVDSRD